MAITNDHFFCLRFLICCNQNNLTGPGGGIGRHAGLKILYPLKMCGFKSRPGYQTSGGSEVRVLPIAIGTAPGTKPLVVYENKSPRVKT